MSELVKMIRDAERNDRPHPLTTVHGPRAVQPIYAISKHELSELTGRIEALEAVLREAREVIVALVDSRWSEVESTGAEEVAFIDAALKQV